MNEQHVYFLHKILADSSGKGARMISFNEKTYDLADKAGLKQFIIDISQEEPSRDVRIRSLAILDSLQIDTIVTAEDLIDIIRASDTDTFISRILAKDFKDKGTARSLLTAFAATAGDSFAPHHALISNIFSEHYMLPREEYKRTRDDYYNTYGPVNYDGRPFTDDWSSRTHDAHNDHSGVVDVLLHYIFSRCTLKDANAFFSSLQHSLSIGVIKKLYEYDNKRMTKGLDLARERTIPTFIKEEFGFDLLRRPF